MKIEILSENEGRTLEIGHKLGKLLKPGSCLLLDGELGAGKTVLARGVGVALGVKHIINSPTFNILKCYEGTELPFYHIDGYRLEDGRNIDIGLEEVIDGHGVTMIEWPEYIKSLWPEAYIMIKIIKIDDDKRKITLESNDPKYDRVLKKLGEIYA